MVKKNQSFDNLKYLLGNMGIDIINAISKGAKDNRTIELFSGVPLPCIRGRIPVLIEFKLIKKNKEGYRLTKPGLIFIQKLNAIPK
jgi:predicted transcriptional regulator